MDEDKTRMIEGIIAQTINGTMDVIPEYIENVKQSIDVLKVKDPKEFVFGMIVGVALGLSSAAMITQDGPPAIEDQQKLYEMVCKHVPQIREQIFG